MDVIHKPITVQILPQLTACYVDELVSDSTWVVMKRWLGWQDSNLRMLGSKPSALPLGDTPTIWWLNSGLDRVATG